MYTSTTLFKIHRKCSECGLSPNLEVLFNVHQVTNTTPSAPTLSRARNHDTSDALVLPFLLGHRLSKEQQISLPRNLRLLVGLTHLSPGSPFTGHLFGKHYSKL